MHFVRGGILLFTVAVLSCAPFSYTTLKKQEAEALFGVGDVVLDPTNLVQNTTNAVNSTALQLKEYVYDGLASSIARHAVRSMTTSIVRWINSGFQGSPAFITDFEGFLRDVGDKVAGEFLSTSNLSFLCSPFKLNVQVALTNAYYQTSQKKLACTLTGALANATNFANSMQSWNDWFQVTTKPQNNQYGVLFLGQQELEKKVAEAKDRAKQEALQNRGFLSFKTCVTVNGKQQCKVVTPGSTIADSLSKSLGASQDTLISSDEINEVVSALFAQLSKQAITSATGLLGLSSASGSSGTSYLDRVDAESTDSGFGLVNNESDPIGDALSNETEVAGLYQSVVAITDEATDLVEQGACDDDEELPSRLSKARAEAVTALPVQNSLVAQLTSLNTTKETTDDPEVKSSVYTQFLDLQGTGVLHTDFDVLELQFEIDNTIESAESYINDCKNTSYGNNH